MTALMTPRQVADRSGLSYDEVLAACKRHPDFHRLPRIACGNKRPRFKIDWDEFLVWRAE